MSPELIVLSIVAGVAVGFLSALFGVGGGILMVPFMVLVLGATQHLAEGTSLLVIVPTAIVGVISHARRGFVRFYAAGLLAAGGIFGSGLGARFALNTDGELLQVLFGALVIFIGVRFVYYGFTADREDGQH